MFVEWLSEQKFISICSRRALIEQNVYEWPSITKSTNVYWAPVPANRDSDTNKNEAVPSTQVRGQEAGAWLTSEAASLRRGLTPGGCAVHGHHG